MQKILVAIDAVNPAMNTLKFACYLGMLTKSTVTGIFLENQADEEQLVLKHLHGMTYVDWEVNKQSDAYKAKLAFIESNILRFKEECIHRGVRYHLHHDIGVPTSELIAETRFADILVVDAATTFIKPYVGTPSAFVKDILKKAACPVIIAPEAFDAVDEIIFSYNDTESSLFAIKQFTYLLPQFCNKKTSIVQVNETGEWQEKDKIKFTKWLSYHYTDMHFDELKGEYESIFLEYLFKRKNRLLVMGAYGRNTVSEFFNKSHADKLMETVSQPIFITHH
jgi:hypothetical protein